MATKIVDLHCDTLSVCLEKDLPLCSEQLHIGFTRRPWQLHLCQAMAIYLTNDLSAPAARERFFSAYQVYLRQSAAHCLPTLRDLRCISQCLDAQDVALFLTVEGGVLLGGDILWVDKLHEMGVKMLTLTMNGPGDICGGVGSQQTFTPFGRQVVRRMEELGMAVDVSHMNETSFWELCEFAERPFCASHSNAQTICAHPRNLTDAQFREIARRGGVVGLNYFRDFIAAGGDTRTVDDLLRHLHHFLDLGGEDTIALGSDFDGCVPAGYIDGIDKLPAFIRSIESSGVGSATVEKILHGNATRYLGGIGK